ncbi:hypothetical protein OH76DRAFT_1333379, partial [Lentinus brumalis]
DEPRGGWLGGGFSKFAIRGTYKGSKYAILQMAPLRDAVCTAEENRNNLMDEFKLLCIAQYFADTFRRRATVYDVAIPDIRFNAEGAFVGEVDPDFLPDSPLEQGAHARALLYPTFKFLATPLVDKSHGYTERKFSGSLQVGLNKDALGRAIDAFAHHVLDDSSRTCVLVDLQGDGWGLTGFWDGGAREIDNFKKAHECNSYCHQLHLSD